MYNKVAGSSQVAGTVADRYGNAAGSAFDLGVDGAFEGLQVAVLQFHTIGMGCSEFFPFQCELLFTLFHFL